MQELRTTGTENDALFAILAGALEDFRPKTARYVLRITLEHARVYDLSMRGKDAMPVGSAHDTRLTYDDFLRFPDDGLRHEIIDGVHYVTASPNLRHQDLIGRLHLAIGGYLEKHPRLGRVFLSPFDVVMTYHDVVEPDLLFVAPDQLEILTAKNVQGTPALVIEVLSPSTRSRDQRIKQRLYQRTGVREYWLVDPDEDAVTVYRREADGSFPKLDVLTSKHRDTIKTPLLPGFSLALTKLFR